MAKKRSGRITLRMGPALHAELAELAPRLGTDLNGLINLLVREGLPAKRALVEEVERQQRAWQDLSLDEQIEQLTRAYRYYNRPGHPGADRDFAATLAVRIHALQEQRKRQGG